MVVAIDGPAGSGKSAVAKEISEQLKFFLLNSGFFYRAITLKCLRIENISADTAIDFANKTSFTLLNNQLLIDNRDISDNLHTDAVSEKVAIISSIPEVRAILNKKMQDLAANQNLVCEGRDMTTVVFPHADVKIYLDASVEVRANRRFRQGVSAMTLDEITKKIEDRDFIDKHKAVGALKIAENAVYIDSSNFSLENIVDKILILIEKARKVGV